MLELEQASRILGPLGLLHLEETVEELLHPRRRGGARQLTVGREQGTVPLDRYRYSSSSDIGFAAEGSWKSNAITAYSGIYNGEGYSNAPGDNRKDFATRVSVRVLKTDNDSRLGGLRVTGFASVGRAGRMFTVSGFTSTR